MKRVIFVQLPPPRFSFSAAPTNIPLAGGFLASALARGGPRGCEAQVLESEVVDVFADHGLLLDIVSRKPRVVALTLYAWNVERSLFLAAGVKRMLPGTRVLIGGPEVTPDNEWVIRHPAVDAAVFGEGESRIAAAVEALLGGKASDAIPGTAFHDRSELRLNADQPPIWNLASCPYPYLDGTISPAPDGTLFIETVRGCPFRCRYCYYHKAFPSVRTYPSETIARVLDWAYGPDSSVREIYLMDPTFNARPGFQDLLRSMARRRSEQDIALHTELRADLLTAADVALLQEAGLKSAEVGLQTVNNRALTMAGRKSDPAKIADGVHLLKGAGIDVTTGIIVGLPGDSPTGVTRTIDWLKRTDAYSVVHPFVLSILPGTDFRGEADRLGLTYDPRPPYYVKSTPKFSEDDILLALLACERVFDMEIDYIAPPLLADSGHDVHTDPAKARYVSKWIVNLDRRTWSKHLARVLDKATDPFTLWFRGPSDEAAILRILTEFSDANPHACVHVVLELTELPDPEFLQRALDAAAHPGHYLNRAYRPLYRHDDVVSVNFWVIAEDPGDIRKLARIREQYLPVASAIWDTRKLERRHLSRAYVPLLYSGRVVELGEGCAHELSRLQGAHGDRAEEVLFRDPDLQATWLSMTYDSGQKHCLNESVLLS